MHAFFVNVSSETELIFFFVNKKLKVLQSCNIPPQIIDKYEAKYLRVTRSLNINSNLDTLITDFMCSLGLLVL